jgi:hypothetical protein
MASAISTWLTFLALAAMAIVEPALRKLGVCMFYL